MCKESIKVKLKVAMREDSFSLVNREESTEELARYWKRKCYHRWLANKIKRCGGCKEGRGLRFKELFLRPEGKDRTTREIVKGHCHTGRGFLYLS